MDNSSERMSVKEVMECPQEDIDTLLSPMLYNLFTKHELRDILLGLKARADHQKSIILDWISITEKFV